MNVGERVEVRVELRLRCPSTEESAARVPLIPFSSFFFSLYSRKACKGCATFFVRLKSSIRILLSPDSLIKSFSRRKVTCFFR